MHYIQTPLFEKDSTSSFTGANNFYDDNGAFGWLHPIIDAIEA